MQNDNRPRNPYEHLRHEEYPDSAPETQYSAYCVSDHPDEQVSILLAEPVPGRWVGGYSVYWANRRRHSFLQPSLTNGWFASRRDAILFYLGFFSTYLAHFIPLNQDAIRRAIGRNSQTSIIDLC